ncbi:hypothetical protein GCM10010910_18100 [Microbacterium nanhaiense]|uniref:Uncharacterized protein n=1 Tax=Microbacterium nanhaiense TaxID=1301026 RepID=A0ABQ2N1V9_9MICO|nr:hypothetical protein [Microbacterium nanhaiense]GGO64085.1 hypothetical protein GCM10010910_18100 [Microbacterium nanhaiense]
MTEIRAREVDPHERDADARPDRRIVDPATRPLEVAAETFGHILPDEPPPLVRHRPRPVTTLVVFAVTLASVGLIVSWFGPWGGGFGILGVLVGVVAHVRQRARRAWCVASYVIGAVSVLYSAYWVWWILDELSKLTPPA